MSPTWVMIQRKALHLLASTHLGLLSSVISKPMASMRQSLQRTWTSSRVSSVAPRIVLLTEDQRRKNRRHQHLDDLGMHSRTQLHQRPRRLPLYILCPRPVVHLRRVLPLLLQTRPLLSLNCHCVLHLRLPACRWPRRLQRHHPHHLHALSRSHLLRRRRRRHLRPPSAVQLYLHRLHFRQDEQGLPLHRPRRLLPQRTVLALHPHRLHRLHRPRHLRVVEHLHPHLRPHHLHLRAEHHLRHHHHHLRPGVVDR